MDISSLCELQSIIADLIKEPRDKNEFGKYIKRHSVDYIPHFLIRYLNEHQYIHNICKFLRELYLFIREEKSVLSFQKILMVLLIEKNMFREIGAIHHQVKFKLEALELLNNVIIPSDQIVYMLEILRTRDELTYLNSLKIALEAEDLFTKCISVDWKIYGNLYFNTELCEEENVIKSDNIEKLKVLNQNTTVYVDNRFFSEPLNLLDLACYHGSYNSFLFLQERFDNVPLNTAAVIHGSHLGILKELIKKGYAFADFPTAYYAIQFSQPSIFNWIESINEKMIIENLERLICSSIDCCNAQLFAHLLSKYKPKFLPPILKNDDFHLAFYQELLEGSDPPDNFEIYYNDIESLKMFIKLTGVKPNWISVFEIHISDIRKLLDLDIEDEKGQSPFPLAIRYPDSIRLLLESHKFDPNNDLNGEVALNIAVKASNLEIVELLLADERTNPLISDANGDTAFDALFSISDEAVGLACHLGYCLQDLKETIEKVYISLRKRASEYKPTVFPRSYVGSILSGL